MDFTLIVLSRSVPLTVLLVGISPTPSSTLSSVPVIALGNDGSVLRQSAASASTLSLVKSSMRAVSVSTAAAAAAASTTTDSSLNEPGAPNQNGRSGRNHRQGNQKSNQQQQVQIASTAVVDTTEPAVALADKENISNASENESVAPSDDVKKSAVVVVESASAAHETLTSPQGHGIPAGEKVGVYFISEQKFSHF